MSTTTEFGKWRSRLWPVHTFELKKVLPMLFLFFLILFNYQILRDTKDSLIVPASGAETIPFLKFWGTLPMAFIFMLVYAKLSNKLSKPALFYTTVIPFIAFFGLFATVLYPLRDTLHPHELCDRLQATLPSGFTGLVSVIRNWTYSLFYIMSELWGSMALSLLFWGFANDITRVSESKRFYNLFGLGANPALIVAGPLIMYFSNIRSKLPHDVDAWQVSLNYLMGMVVGAGVLIIGIYWWINRYVLTDSRFYDAKDVKKKKEKPKMSIGESFKYLMRSKYLGCIALLVLCYGISVNVIEVVWKKQLGAQFTNHNDYSTFMGLFTFVTGIISTLTMLFVGGNVIRKLGWKMGALVTPVVMLATGAVFLSLILGGNMFAGIASAMGTTTLMMAVIVGMSQNILTKSCKYSMFDPTKEMAYIPLDQEQKVKGKAAIDVVGARLGKSGGSLILQGLIIAFSGQLVAAIPYVAGTVLVICVTWIYAARALSKRFEVANAEKEAELAAEEAVGKTQELAQTEAATVASTKS